MADIKFDPNATLTVRQVMRILASLIRAGKATRVGNVYYFHDENP